MTDTLRIGVIGDQIEGFAPHQAIDDAVAHSAARLDRQAYLAAVLAGRTPAGSERLSGPVVSP